MHVRWRGRERGQVTGGVQMAGYMRVRWRGRERGQVTGRTGRGGEPALGACAAVSGERMECRRLARQFVSYACWARCDGKVVGETFAFSFSSRFM
jgi:hypothetical protein